MVKYQEFINTLQSRLNGYSLVEFRTIPKLTFDDHKDEKAIEYHVVYHAKQNDEWECKNLGFFRFDNDDLLILTFTTNDNKYRTLPREDYDVCHLIKQFYDIAHPIANLVDFLELSRNVAPELTLKAIKGKTQTFNNKVYQAYTFIDIAPTDYPFSSERNYKDTTIYINGKEVYMKQKNEDYYEMQNGLKCLVMNCGDHVMPSCDYEKVLKEMVDAYHKRIEDNNKWKATRVKEEIDRKQATAEGRTKEKPTIQQRQAWGKKAYQTFLDELDEHIKNDDIYETSARIYYDCYAGVDSWSDDEDAYEAYLIISAYGGMMTDDYQWSEMTLKVVEAIFPEYEISEEQEGLYSVAWKNGEVISKDEIKEFNDILSQIDGFELWCGERCYTE